MNPTSLSKVFFVCMLLAGLVWFMWPAENNQNIKYHTQALSQGKIESTVNSSGSISPVVTVDVGSELSGLISQLNVDFNDVVKSGQVIARIDDRTVLSRLRQSEADLASSQASLVQLQTALARAETESALANRELQRTRKVRASKLISEAELDSSETEYQLALVNIEAARAAILVGESRILQSQSSVEQVKLDLDRTYIRSPVDGVIIDRQVDKGQAVSASLSAPTLFTIAQDLEKMQIEADVDEADIGRIMQEQKVKFTVDAFPERSFEGIVAQVRKAATITSNVVTYKVIIKLENKDLVLLPGMTANIDIILGQRSDVLRVSNSALRFSPGTDAQTHASQNDSSERIQRMATELQLTNEQGKQLALVMAEMQQAMQTLGESRNEFAGVGGQPTDMREKMRKLRSKTEAELKGFLSPEQMEKYQALNANRRQNRDQNSDMQRGTLWVLRDGKPARVDVRVGIADLEYSEVVSAQLKDGDLIIVRAQRLSE